MAASGGASGSLPKWQLALVVGAPVALGLGYMYYKNCASNKPEDKPTRGKYKRSGKENGEKQISIDGDVPTKSKKAPANETPLEIAQNYKEEGNKLFKSGKYDEAIVQYNLAIETCPKDSTENLATFYHNRAAAYEKLKKFSAVKSDCTKALELKPKYIKALIRRAKVLEINNDLETALEDITAACILERFSNKSSLCTADNILKLLGKQHADSYLATKKPVMPSKSFINTYFMAFLKDPIASKIDELTMNGDKDTSFAKALEAFKNKDYDDVIPLCTEELNSLPVDEDSLHKMKVLLLRATFSFLLGQHESALADLTSVINTDVDCNDLKVNALIKRAALHIQLEDIEKGFADFEAAEKIDPNCGDIYHNRGQVNLIMEKINEAKADLDKAVELNPDFGLVFVQKCYVDYRYAISTRDSNLINTSLTNFNKAFEKFPDCAECYMLYAQVLTDTQDYAKADVYYLKAAKRDPENPTVLVHRGLLHLQWQKNIEKTLEYIRKAIELDEKCEYAYETLGAIEVQRGNLDVAINLFDKAIALARTPTELAHLFGLRFSAKTQLVVIDRLGSDIIKPFELLS